MIDPLLSVRNLTVDFITRGSWKNVDRGHDTRARGRMRVGGAMGNSRRKSRDPPSRRPLRITGF